MDCRKARYCLVASFDGPLSAEDKQHLAYHLKDCRSCRHEAFYYRELFSATQQLEIHAPKSDFNERLLAEIRMREAQAAWPSARPVARRRPRWSLVYVPALFAAAAAFGFFAFLPSNGNQEPSLADQSVSTPAHEPTAQVTRTADFSPDAGLNHTQKPRYLITIPDESRTFSGVMFQLPASTKPTTDYASDAFRRVLVSQSQGLQPLRQQREQERYVLPIVSQTAQRERIY